MVKYFIFIKVVPLIIHGLISPAIDKLGIYKAKHFPLLINFREHHYWKNYGYKLEMDRATGPPLL